MYSARAFCPGKISPSMRELFVLEKIPHRCASFLSWKKFGADFLRGTLRGRSRMSLE